jgi:hypothetical protein
MQTVTQDLLDTFASLQDEDILEIKIGNAQWRSLIGPWFETEIVLRTKSYKVNFSRKMILGLTNLHKHIPETYRKKYLDRKD